MASRKFPTFSDLTPQELQYLAITPAYQPPPGITPNFRNPTTNTRPLYAVSSLLLGLSVIFMVCRIHQKLVVIRKPSIDDRTFKSPSTITSHLIDILIVTLSVGFVRPST